MTDTRRKLQEAMGSREAVETAIRWVKENRGSPWGASEKGTVGRIPRWEGVEENIGPR